MSFTQRLTLWLLLITMLLSGVCLWSYQQLILQKRLAQITANDQNKCEKIAQTIQSIQQQAQSLQPADDMNSLVQQIQQAASQAAMPMNHVQRIRPSSPRRLGQSPYVEMPTQLSLQDVTMKNAITFLHHLADAQPDMQIQSLRITSPRSQRSPNTPANMPETWQFQVGLASLAYLPQTNSKN